LEETDREIRERIHNARKEKKKKDMEQDRAAVRLSYEEPYRTLLEDPNLEPNPDCEAVYRILEDVLRHVMPKENVANLSSVVDGMKSLATMLTMAQDGSGWQGVAEVPGRGRGEPRPREGQPGHVAQDRWSPLRWKQPSLMMSLMFRGSQAERMATGLRVLIGPPSMHAVSDDESEEEDMFGQTGLSIEEMIAMRSRIKAKQEAKAARLKLEAAEASGLDCLGLFGKPWYRELGLSKEEEKGLMEMSRIEEGKVISAEKDLSLLEKEGVLSKITKARSVYKKAQKEYERMTQELKNEPRFAPLQAMEAYKTVSPEELRWEMRQAEKRDALYIATILNLMTTLSPGSVRQTSHKEVSLIEGRRIRELDDDALLDLSQGITEDVHVDAAMIAKTKEMLRVYSQNGWDMHEMNVTDGDDLALSRV